MIIKWREALSATACFGHVPLVIWLGTCVGNRVIKMTLFTCKPSCDSTLTSPEPVMHMSWWSMVPQHPTMASIFRRTLDVGVAMHFISINIFSNSREGLWIFHWIIRIHHDPILNLFSACMLEICGVWNVVIVPVSKLGNVRMLLSWAICQMIYKTCIIWFPNTSGIFFYRFHKN